MSQRKELNHRWDNPPYLCCLTASDKAGRKTQKRDFRGQFADCGNCQQLLKYDRVSKAVKAAPGACRVCARLHVSRRFPRSNGPCGLVLPSVSAAAAAPAASALPPTFFFLLDFVARVRARLRGGEPAAPSAASAGALGPLKFVPLRSYLVLELSVDLQTLSAPTTSPSIKGGAIRTGQRWKPVTASLPLLLLLLPRRP